MGDRRQKGKSSVSSPLVTREWMGGWRDLQESLDELLALVVYLPT